MKKFYFLAICVSVYNFCFSAPPIKTVKSGNWTNHSTWDADRQPAAGDTIIISEGDLISIDKDVPINGGVYMKIYGTLDFTKNAALLTVEDPSTIIVYDGGQIQGVSNSDQIRIANNIVFKGDDPVSGPAVASTITGAFVPFTPVVLPVKFVGFTVTRKSTDVLVQWATSEEKNAGEYKIERSTDGANWNTIASLRAAANSSSVNNYSYTDKNVSAPLVYYRVKQIDITGKSTVTAVQSVRDDVTAATEIRIASIQNKVLLQFPVQVSGALTVRFVSLSGQVVTQQLINNPVGQVVLNSPVTGHYIISVSNGKTINTAKQVIL